MAAVRAGDDHAFEQLYHRYQRRIGAYIYGMVHDHGRAEDITQDVFMSALRRMRATETPIAFKPWVYEIAKNACIDAFRRSKRAEEISYRRRRWQRAPAPREQGPDARGRGRYAHVARPPARCLRRAVRGPPPDPRHARARGPELPRDRRAPRHEPPVGGVDALPRPPAPLRGVRGARLRRALPAHPVDHRRRDRRPRGHPRRAQDGAPRLLLPALPARRPCGGLRPGHARSEALRAREDRRAAAAARPSSSAASRATTVATTPR